MNALQGRLGPGVLAHLLQYLAQNGAAGRLNVQGEGVGVGHVYLGQGRVIHADLDAEAGVPALAQMLEWERGRFAFQVGVMPPGSSIDLPVDRLLLSMAIARDGRQGDDGLPAAGRNGAFQPTPLVEPGVVPGLVWAAVVLAGPIGEIFVTEAFEAIGHHPRLLPEDQLGTLVLAIARQFRSEQGRRDFLTRAEAVLSHHGYGRVEG